MSGEHLRQWIDRRRSAWHYWVTRFLPVSALTPLRIASIYAIFGFAALIVSDILLVRYVSEPLLSQLQVLKGGVEVILTAGLIFVLTNRRETQLRRSRDRLDHQRKELDVLHRLLRHNLRNDLSVVHGYTERIRGSLSSDSLREACDVILHTVEGMTAYTEQASRINKLAHESENRRTYDLVENLPKLLDDHPRVTGDVDVSTTLPGQATVEASSMFEEALREVIANAIEHNDAETPTVEITVRPETEPSHMVEISVADNGPGIPPSEREPLQAGEEGQLLHISGIGLWFVKWTIEHSGGELAFEDNENGGTTVRMRVPKAPEMFIHSILR